jgi:hypothetical protein
MLRNYGHPEAALITAAEKCLQYFVIGTNKRQWYSHRLDSPGLGALHSTLLVVIRCGTQHIRKTSFLCSFSKYCKQTIFCHYVVRFTEWCANSCLVLVLFMFLLSNIWAEVRQYNTLFIHLNLTPILTTLLDIQHVSTHPWVTFRGKKFTRRIFGILRINYTWLLKEI